MIRRLCRCWRLLTESTIQTAEPLGPEVIADQLRRPEATDEGQVIAGVVRYLHRAIAQDLAATQVDVGSDINGG